MQLFFVALVGYVLFFVVQRFTSHDSALYCWSMCYVDLWESHFKCHLKIRYHERGLCLKNYCVMNMTIPSLKYKGGCVLTFWGGGAG